MTGNHALCLKIHVTLCSLLKKMENLVFVFTVHPSVSTICQSTNQTVPFEAAKLHNHKGEGLTYGFLN